MSVEKLKTLQTIGAVNNQREFKLQQGGTRYYLNQFGGMDIEVLQGPKWVLIGFTLS